MASLKDVTQTLTFLTALYPRFDLTTNTIRAYHLLLEDLEAGLLQAAALSLAGTSPFFPALSELRGAALELELRASGVPTADQAWGEVMDQVSRTGYYGSPTFSHPLVRQAVRALGGWRSLCASDNAVADRAHFFKIYERLLERHVRDATMLPQVRRAIEGLAPDDARGLAPGDTRGQARNLPPGSPEEGPWPLSTEEPT